MSFKKLQFSPHLVKLLIADQVLKYTKINFNNSFNTIFQHKLLHEWKYFPIGSFK